MSKLSAIENATFQGSVTVKDAGLVGMITLRGDLSDSVLIKSVKSLTGADLPAQRKVIRGKSGTVAWMSPDELLLITDHAKAAPMVAKLNKAMKDTHFLAADVSDARCAITLGGAGIRDIISKGSPADLSTDALPVGELRRTRIAQLPAAFWFSAEDQATVICFRSVGRYMFDWFKNAAKPGSEVGFHD